MSRPLILAITGASGAVYATRLLEVLSSTGYNVHLTISPAGQAVLKQELDIAVDLDNFLESSLMLGLEKSTSDSSLDLTRSLAGVSSEESAVLPISTREPGQIIYHHFQDLMAPIASGSFLTGGMIVCPCSGATLSAVARGASSHLIHRAAEVHLKERRKLVLVPRESPLSLVQLENMRLAVQAGAVMLPAMPGWYHGVKTLRDLVDFVVARILDQLEIEHTLIRRWGEHDSESEGEAASL